MTSSLFLTTLLSSATQPALGGDTLVLVQSRDALDIVYGVAAGTFVLLLLALLLVVLGVLAQARKAVRSLERTAAEIREGEAVARVGRTLGHVEAMAARIREETDQLSASVSKVGDQVTLASRRMEERIEEFNALLAVVQEEAEEVFLDTASTARGVRRGIGALGNGGSRRRSGRRSEDRAKGTIAPPSAPPATPPTARGAPATTTGAPPLSPPASPPAAADSTPPAPPPPAPSAAPPSPAGSAGPFPADPGAASPPRTGAPPVAGPEAGAGPGSVPAAAPRKAPASSPSPSSPPLVPDPEAPR